MNRWDTLTMGEKNQLLGIYASKGYNNLANIIAHYNSFAEGGNVNGEEDDIDNRTGKPRYRRDIQGVSITSSSNSNIEGAARDTSTIGPLAFYPPKYYIGRQGNQFTENPNVTYDSWFDEHPEMIDVMTDIVGRYNNRLNNRGQQLPQLNRYYFEKLYNPEDDPIIHEAIDRMLQAKWNRDVRTYNDNRTLNLWDTVEKFPVTTVKEPQEYANGGHLFAFGTPDYDPDNPYHYHTDKGEKVVITPEDWEANKGKSYFKEVEAAVNAERTAHPGPEYEIDPKFVSTLSNNYASQLANTSGALNYRNFARQLPEGYTINNQGVVFDKEGNAYVQDWYNGGTKYTYDRNNPTTFTFTFGPNNQRNVNFYPVNMEGYKTIKTPLSVDKILQIQDAYTVSLDDLFPGTRSGLNLNSDILLSDAGYFENGKWNNNGGKERAEKFLSDYLGRKISFDRYIDDYDNQLTLTPEEIRKFGKKNTRKQNTLYWSVPTKTKQKTVLINEQDFAQGGQLGHIIPYRHKFQDGNQLSYQNKKVDDWMQNWYNNRTNVVLNNLIDYDGVEAKPRDFFKNSRISQNVVNNALSDTRKIPVMYRPLYKDVNGFYRDFNDITLQYGAADDVLLHEKSHALNDIIRDKWIENGQEFQSSPFLQAIGDVTDKDLYDDGQWKRVYDYYLDDPNEIYSRLMQIRYNNNINPRKYWKLEEIKKLRKQGKLNLPKSEGLEGYSDEFILHLFNDVAQNDNSEELSNNAANGGKLGKVTPYGQWQYPHQVTTIPSNNITMQGVDYPVVGISNTGDVKYMLPNMDYLFDGQYVTEYPIK